MSALRIIFAGAGEFGLPALEAVRDRGHQIVQVISQPDRPAGRGRALTPTPVAAFALANGLPLIRTPGINDQTLPPADLMLVIAFGQKIARSIVDHPRLGSVNLHASRLPRYRGAAPINWAIMRGETIVGNSIIRLADRMDAGAILGQSALTVGELETAGELHDRLARDGAELTATIIGQLTRGDAIERSQDEALATLAPKLTRDAARLDWSRSAIELSRLIRGLYPWPGCRVRLVDEGGKELSRATLVRARAVGDAPAAACGAPGAIDSSLRITAGQGTVEIVELQPEGKRPMPLADYRNGNPWKAGARVESIQ
jgi:methionyl-tRNA formyltransferase